MRKLNLVTVATTAILILIAIIALVEKGPPHPYIFRGASPANIGILGTYSFLQQLKQRYPATIAVFSTENLHIPKDVDHCLYISISPELEYSANDVQKIVNELLKCRRPALLIADESTISNTLLKAVGSSIRILGYIVLDPSEYRPYPQALFTIDSVQAKLTLDIASAVQGGDRVLGTVLRALLHTPQGVVEANNVPVAVYDEVGRVRVVVIGDGSIFLNQVLSSSVSHEYLRVLMALVDMLCESDRNCFIVIEGSKYQCTSVIEVVRRPYVTDPYELIQAIPLLIATLLHPSTWLPPVIRALNNIISQALTVREIATILTLLLIAVGYRLARVGSHSERDTKLEEQQEVEVFFTADIRSAITRGKYKLDENDFLRLYEIVSSVLKSVTGYGLEDPQLVDVLSRSVDRSRVVRYVDRMNRLRRKVVDGRFLPIVISWHRTTLEMVRESEYILRAVGTSLEAEKGIEYVIMRGIR